MAEKREQKKNSSRKKGDLESGLFLSLCPKKEENGKRSHGSIAQSGIMACIGIHKGYRQL